MFSKLSPPPPTEICAVYKTVWKNIVGQVMPQIDDRMEHAYCSLVETSNTHSEYVILISFPLQQWLHERASMLRYAYVICLVTLSSHLRRRLPSGLCLRVFLSEPYVHFSCHPCTPLSQPIFSPLI
jgi:hypothetical protein